jgi:hypothetical protein
MELGIEHFTVHEAEFAVFHAWRDGMPVTGPLDRHQATGLITRFTSGLKMTRDPVGEVPRGFGEWRAKPGVFRHSEWTVETSGAVAALFEGGTLQVNAFLPQGAPLILLVRFYSEESGRWRLFQFHDCEIGPVNAADSSENMMQAVTFHAGWMEELTGASGGTLPSMVPRLRGVIEWRHAGRCVACWFYDAADDSFTENPENVATVGEETVRYVSLAEDEDGMDVSYLAAMTVPAPDPVAGLPAVGIGWADVRALQINEVGGLVLEPGWVLQEGAAEPITLPPSGMHWEHPQVVFRFLGRTYATLAHGVFCVPSLTNEAVEPFDFPIRLGRLVLLPDGAWVLPS